MRLSDMIIKEYISIVEYLEQKHGVENNRIVVDKEEFKTLLEKYPYIKFREKTKIYKDLNFIIHDKTSYTMPHKDPISKKTIRKVIINYITYQSIKHINTTEINI